MARKSRHQSRFAARRGALAAFVGVAALFGALLTPAAANAADPIDAMISGTITADAGGAPLEFVTVFAESADDGSTFAGESDANGDYAITDLPAGDYTMSFIAPEGTDYVTEWFSNSVTVDESEYVTIAESEARVIDAGLALGGTLAGTVTGLSDVTLADVLVQVFTADSGAQLGAAVTEDNGLYSFRGIPTTGVLVSFTDDAGRGYITQWSNNRASQETADRITLTAGGTKSVPASLTIGGSISGSVQAPTGSALAEGDVQVTLTLASGDGSEPVDTQFTDAAGAYSFAGVAAGNYVVQFSDAADAGYSPQWWNGVATREAATVVTVTAGQPTNGINATLKKGSSIAGVVRGGAGSASVVLENALVTAVNDEGTFVTSAYTDESGAYTLTGFAPGTYSLNFEAPEGTAYSPEWWNNQPDYFSADVIAVSLGVALTNYNAELALAGSITGTVTGSDRPGTGIANVYVAAYDDFGGIIAETTTSSTGQYELEALPAGVYRVQFDPTEAPTYAAQWWNNKPTMELAQDITVKAGIATTGKNAVLQRGGTIAGTVTGGDAPTVGLPDVEVTAYDIYGNIARVTETTADGTFLLQGMPAGEFSLGYHHLGDPAVYLDEYWNNHLSIDDSEYFTATASSAITGKNATLAVGATLSGTITGDDAPTVPLDGVVVELFAANHDYVADTETTSDGTYSFAALAPGTYKVSFTGQNGSRYGSEWWNDAASFSTATGIVLAEASVVTANAGLVADPQPLDTPPIPVISGLVRVGSTVTADAGTWTPTPVELSYQWNAYGEPISGAIDSTYEISADYYEASLSVTVTGGKVGYISRSVTSADTDPIATGVFPRVVPVITGPLVVGKTLTVTPGDWTADDVEFRYRWKNNGANISGAVGSTYKLQKTDAGDSITVTVSGTAYAFDDASRSSDAVTIQNIFLKSPNPTIVGKAVVGKKLTAKAGSWKPSSAKFTAQWFRNGTAIVGATKSNYVLVKADRGTKITVAVTAKKSTYSTLTRVSKALTVK